MKIIIALLLGSFFFMESANAEIKTYEGIGEYQRAAVDYTRAIELDNRNISAYLGRGIANYYLRAYNSAISDLNAVIQLDNRNAKAYYTRGLCFDKIYRRYDALRDFGIARYLGYRD